MANDDLLMRLNALAVWLERIAFQRGPLQTVHDAIAEIERLEARIVDGDNVRKMIRDVADKREAENERLRAQINQLREAGRVTDDGFELDE